MSVIRAIVAVALVAAGGIAATGSAANALVKHTFLEACPVVIKVVHTHPTIKYAYRDCSFYRR
jgi:hypothetical protein